MAISTAEANYGLAQLFSSAQTPYFSTKLLRVEMEPRRVVAAKRSFVQAPKSKESLPV
jgi:hypothetical protein